MTAGEDRGGEYNAEKEKEGEKGKETEAEEKGEGVHNDAHKEREERGHHDHAVGEEREGNVPCDEEELVVFGRGLQRGVVEKEGEGAGEDESEGRAGYNSTGEEKHMNCT